MRAKTCAACGGKMVSIGSFPLQKGRFGPFLGGLSNLISGALDVGAMCCEDCRRLEFYLADDVRLVPEEDVREDSIAQVECPFCGVMHDLDDAICPQCGHRLMD